MRDVAELVARGETEAAEALLPAEAPYPVGQEVAFRLGMAAPG